MPKGLFITGNGTEIGKTVASAVVVEALRADYWKPVQSGGLDHTDSDTVRKLVSNPSTVIHPERYRLQAPLSPHASAALDGVEIRLRDFALPRTQNSIVVEGAGGLMVPLSLRELMVDLIESLQLPVLVVSRTYLGSINHTLLTLEALQRRGIPIAGVLFNGEKNAATEEAILTFSGERMVGRLPALHEVTARTVAEQAALLRDDLKSALA